VPRNHGPAIRQRVEESARVTVELAGSHGGKKGAFCDHFIRIPSTETPRIQESHMLIGHTICEIVESEIFGHLKPKS
jgi:D-sedoheptulose 7-phosphate isomerase